MQTKLTPRERRIRQMRSAAHSKGKYVPPEADIALLLGARLGRCQLCKRQMVWNAKDDWSRVVTLQHDVNGDIRLLCHRCNIRHRSIPDDGIYTMPLGTKYCARCARFLPVGEFSPRKYRPAGLLPECRECNRAKCRAAYRKRRDAQVPK